MSRVGLISVVLHAIEWRDSLPGIPPSIHQSPVTVQLGVFAEAHTVRQSSFTEFPPMQVRSDEESGAVVCYLGNSLIVPLMTFMATQRIDVVPLHEGAHWTLVELVQVPA